MRARDTRSTWRNVNNRLDAGSPRLHTALLLLAVIIVAAVLRIGGLVGDPPGFRHEEASVALAAQRIEGGNFPVYFTQGADAIEPAFVYATALTSWLAGWGVDGPRLAAALLGILAAAGCSLWYRQSLGPGWGLIGGLIVATSFWQIAFSSQAVPAISMAAVGAFALWALYRATEQRPALGRRSLPSGWYGLAGLLLGAGIYTDVAMRALLPIGLLLGTFLFFKKGYLYPAADGRGLLLGGIVMLLVAAPLISYFWQNPENFQQGIDNLRDSGTFVEHLRSTIAAIGWSGESNPAHTYVSRPLLDPVLLVWGVVGLLASLRRPLHAVHAGALIWLTGFLLIITLVAPGDHGQMLALTPVLFFFPVRGMQAILTGARERGRVQGTVVLTAIVISVTGSAAWGIVTYVQWTADDDTYRAFNGDVVETVRALEDLPDNDLTVYFAIGEHGRIVRYLAPDRDRRDFENPQILPMPASGPAYLAVPASFGLPETLAQYLSEDTLVTSGTGPDGDLAYRIWLVDDRVRDRLPYAAPAIPFENGPVLIGFEVAPLAGSSDEPAIDVVLVYRVAPSDESFSSLLRLVGVGGETPGPRGTLVRPGRDDVVTGDEIILSRVVLPFPDTPDMVADLQTAVQTLDGEFLIPQGPNVVVSDEVFVLLNAIGYIGPAP